MLQELLKKIFLFFYIYINPVEGRTKIWHLKNLILTLFGLIIYVWKLNQTVLELDFRAVKFLFFARRDLNSHHWYTAAPFAYIYILFGRNLTIYYEFSLLHIFSLVLQPWMSAYIRKTDGVYISVPKND